MLVPEGSPHGCGHPRASVLVWHEAEGPRHPLGRGAVSVLLKLRRVYLFLPAAKPSGPRVVRVVVVLVVGGGAVCQSIDYLFTL